MQPASIADLDLDIEAMERDMPPGMTLSIQPPVQEYLNDPMWFDQVGRDPIDQRKIFQRHLTPSELKDALAAVLAEWPRYGPALYEKAAMQGRRDAVQMLLELGARSDPASMREVSQDGEEDGDEDDVPLYADLMEHGYLKAIIHGHLEIVKLFVEKGDVPINYVDPEMGLLEIAYACTTAQGGPWPEILQYLLEHGAVMKTGDEDDDRPLNDLSVAIKGGSMDCVRLILADRQAIDAGLKANTGDLPLAANSGNLEMVRWVLQSEAFGIKTPDEGLGTTGQTKLDNDQREAVISAICQALMSGKPEIVRLLLKQLTTERSDKSFEPFPVSLGEEIHMYNTVEEAMDSGGHDIPESFEILWDSCLSQTPVHRGEEDAKFMILPNEEELNRLLISACANGRPKMAKVLVEKYDADVNHVSHKYFTTPLGRATGSGRNDVQGRIEIAEYLCSLPQLDIGLANGEFCNGITPLGRAVEEASHGRKKRRVELARVVRAMLAYGGPVEGVRPEVQQQCDEASASEVIEVHVLLALDEVPRRPVWLSLEGDESQTDIVLEYSPRELRGVLRGLKIRDDDENLRANDPRHRPLMPPPGEQVPEEQRVKPTLLSQHVE